MMSLHRSSFDVDELWQTGLAADFLGSAHARGIDEFFGVLVDLTPATTMVYCTRWCGLAAFGTNYRCGKAIGLHN